MGCTSNAQWNLPKPGTLGHLTGFSVFPHKTFKASSLAKLATPNELPFEFKVDARCQQVSERKVARIWEFGAKATAQQGGRLPCTRPTPGLNPPASPRLPCAAGVSPEYCTAAWDPKANKQEALSSSLRGHAP